MAKTPKFANAKVFAWVDKGNKICTPDKIAAVITCDIPDGNSELKEADEKSKQLISKI